jgi:hypothetical protein
MVWWLLSSALLPVTLSYPLLTATIEENEEEDQQKWK